MVHCTVHIHSGKVHVHYSTCTFWQSMDRFHFLCRKHYFSEKTPRLYTCTCKGFEVGNGIEPFYVRIYSVRLYVLKLHTKNQSHSVFI